MDIPGSVYMHCSMKKNDRTLCTGNPDKFTIAWAAKEKWPGAKTISISNGWDLTSGVCLEKFRFSVKEFDFFINSSFIAPGVQANLLDIVVEEWMKHDIKGHVINLGSTIEWDDRHGNSSYVKSKIDLRKKSLMYNDQTGITGVKTTYMIVGGINNRQPESQHNVDPGVVIETMSWVFQNPNRIGLIQLDTPK